MTWKWEYWQMLGAWIPPAHRTISSPNLIHICSGQGDDVMNHDSTHPCLLTHTKTHSIHSLKRCLDNALCNFYYFLLLCAFGNHLCYTIYQSQCCLYCILSKYEIRRYRFLPLKLCSQHHSSQGQGSFLYFLVSSIKRLEIVASECRHNRSRNNDT